MSAAEQPIVAFRVEIYGRVQGVWFRAWTEKTARNKGLSGWVRNRSDGSVEALIVGPANEVEAMIGECSQGPPAARVDDVVRQVYTGEDASQIYRIGFRQLPTV